MCPPATPPAHPWSSQFLCQKPDEVGNWLMFGNSAVVGSAPVTHLDQAALRALKKPLAALALELPQKIIGSWPRPIMVRDSLPGSRLGVQPDMAHDQGASEELLEEGRRFPLSRWASNQTRTWDERRPSTNYPKANST